MRARRHTSMRVPLATPSCAASSVLSLTGSFSALLTSAGTPHGSAIAQSYSSALERYKLELVHERETSGSLQ
jgi:hypothetical protein